MVRIIIAAPLALLLSLFTIHYHPNFCTAHSDSEVRCIESERHALLNFKQHLTDPSNRLASWAASASDVDCCHWVGVVCHNRTGRVLQLHLRTHYPVYDELSIYDEVQREAYEAYERSRFGGYSSRPLESLSVVIKGKDLEYSTTLQLVKIIDLSNNNLSGEIPKEVTCLKGLQSLNFSFNILTGRIPEKIGDLGLVESIDFSSNQLFGQIPQSMSSLTFLSQLNLSNNNLIGRIPSSTQLQSLNASNFFGNKLCGPPLIDNCTIKDVQTNIENKECKAFSGVDVDWFYVSMALGFVVGLWVVLGPLLLNKQWRLLYFQFLDHLGYKLRGLVAQT